MKIQIKKLYPQAIIPAYAKKGSACFDISALVNKEIYNADSFIKGVFSKDIISVGKFNKTYVQILADIPTIIIPPGQRRIFKTGLVFNIPVGYEIEVRSRSGMAIKYGVNIINQPCTIDSFFLDELLICLQNNSNQSFSVCNGDRIAQAKINQVIPVEFNEITEFDENTLSNNRGGGIGSSGK